MSSEHNERVLNVALELTEKTVLGQRRKNGIPKPGWWHSGAWQGTSEDVDNVLEEGHLPDYKYWRLGRIPAAIAGAGAGVSLSIMGVADAVSRIPDGAKTGGDIALVVAAAWLGSVVVRNIQRGNIERKIKDIDKDVEGYEADEAKSKHLDEIWSQTGENLAQDFDYRVSPLMESVVEKIRKMSIAEEGSSDSQDREYLLKIGMISKKKDGSLDIADSLKFNGQDQQNIVNQFEDALSTKGLLGKNRQKRW